VEFPLDGGANSLNLDFTSYLYEIRVSGNVLGTPGSAIGVGVDPGATAGIGTSGPLTGDDASFTITGPIGLGTVPTAVGNNIRIRREGGGPGFRVTQIEIVTVDAPAQTLIDAAEYFAGSAVNALTVGNDTTAAYVLAAARSAIPNAGIGVAWSATNGFVLVPSNTADGSITGTIVLTLDGLTADIVLNLTIPGAVDGYVFNMQDLTEAEAEAHFAGSDNNRGRVTVNTVVGDLVATVGQFVPGPGYGMHDPLDWAWSPITILRPGQAAAGDTLTVTGNISGTGIIPMNGTQIGLALGIGATRSTLIANGRIDDGNNNMATPYFSLTVVLTAEAAAQGLSIRWNSWGSLGGTAAYTTGFAINITGVTVERD